jgi:hypothetical protein
MSSKTIDNARYTVQPGTVIKLDNGCEREIGRADWLEGVEGWDHIKHAWPTVIGPVAIIVDITGRTIQYKPGRMLLRVRVEFVGDGEPSTFASGWAYVSTMKEEVCLTM